MQTLNPAFRHLDELCNELNWNLAAEDQKWSLAASKLAFEERMRAKVEGNSGKKVGSVRRTLSEPTGAKFGMGKAKQKGGDEAKRDAIGSQFNADWQFNFMQENASAALGGILNTPDQSLASQNVDKRFKSLPQAETLPRGETLGGYIFVCNNDTMQEDLKRQLFGLPRRYRDSVRAIQPGLPLFLYNYTTHQLHGIFEAASFGGSNIDPSAWEDKKCKGESRFPAQVRSRVRRICKPLDEDSFRPILHHYDGPKFRLQLSIPETLALLDLFNEGACL